MGDLSHVYLYNKNVVEMLEFLVFNLIPIPNVVMPGNPRMCSSIKNAIIVLYVAI